MPTLKTKTPFLEIDFQKASDVREIPIKRLYERIIAETLLGVAQRAQLTLRFVASEESRYLNSEFRGKDTPTNVLSFPAENISHVLPDFLGDIVLCVPLVKSEAAEQGKSEQAHFAHLTVHGVLHLIGYSHSNRVLAERMERREIEVLSLFGFEDPYISA